jgi:hypothetical protein
MPARIRLPGLRDKRQSGPPYTVRLTMVGAGGSMDAPCIMLTARAMPVAALAARQRPLSALTARANPVATLTERGC